MFQHLVTNGSNLHCSCTPSADLVVPAWQHYTPVQSSPCDHPSYRKSQPLKPLHWWCSPGVPLMMASFSLHCRSRDPWWFFAKILIIQYFQKYSPFFLGGGGGGGLINVANSIKVMCIFFFTYILIFTPIYMHYCALTINSSRADANSPAPSYGWASEAPEAWATPDIVLTASTSCW